MYGNHPDHAPYTCTLGALELEPVKNLLDSNAEVSTSSFTSNCNRSRGNMWLAVGARAHNFPDLQIMCDVSKTQRAEISI